MKKLLLCTTISLVLTACGGSNTSVTIEPAPTPIPTTTTPKNVIFFLILTSFLVTV